jgi:putative transposase
MSNATTNASEGGREVLPAELAGADSRRAGRRRSRRCADRVDRARSEGVSLTGEDGLLTSMVREVLQAGLDVEMAEHLGYEPYESAGRGSGNSRNGSYQKTVKTDVGPVELRMPRDRRARLSP